MTQGTSVEIEVPGAVGTSAFPFLLPTGRPRDLIDGAWVTCMNLAEPVLLVCAETFPASPTAGQIESIRRQAGYLLGMGDVSGSDHPALMLVQFRKQSASFALEIVPQGVFSPELSAATVAVACTVADSVAYEYCPLPPLLVPDVDEYEEALPDWVLMLFMNPYDRPGFTLSVWVSQCCPNLRLRVLTSNG